MHIIFENVGPYLPGNDLYNKHSEYNSNLGGLRSLELTVSTLTLGRLCQRLCNEFYAGLYLNGDISTRKVLDQ